MTDLITFLEDLYGTGRMSAQAHFDCLVRCAKMQLPEPMHVFIPVNMDEMQGLFTASADKVAFTMFSQMPDYETISAHFDYKPKPGAGLDWELTKFSFTPNIFSPTYTVSTLQDAVVMSRTIAKWKKKGQIELFDAGETAVQ